MTSRNLSASGILVICAVGMVLGEDRLSIPTDATERQSNTIRIDQELRSQTEIFFSEVPLEEAMKELADRHRIQIWLDRHSLQDEGIPPDLQVTLTVSGVTLDSGLNLLLEPHGLSYVNEHEVLKITTQLKADEKQVTRVYPVRDLIDRGPGGVDYQTLMRTIQQTTVGKWMEIDQEGGAVSPFDNAESLVVRQNQKVHREIEGILSALRRSRQLQGIGAVPINPETSSLAKAIESTASSSGFPIRSSRSTQAWQSPRIYSAE